MPAPRKLREASVRITSPTCSVNMTMKELNTLGIMWTNMIRAPEQPCTRASAI